MIESKEDFKDRFSTLKELLGNVLDAHDIVLYPDKGAIHTSLLQTRHRTIMLGTGYPLKLGVLSTWEFWGVHPM